MQVKIAPFETFAEHAEREQGEEPYNDAFIARCREKAKEYAQLGDVLRPSLLAELKRSIPRHFWGKVFKEGV